MTAGGPVVRACAFGEPSPGLWGVAWALDPPADPFVALGYGTHATTASAVLEGAHSTSEWSLRGEGVELKLSSTWEPVVSSDATFTGFDQLCRVRGRVAVAGAEREVDCLGYRGLKAIDWALDEWDSIRLVAAVVEPDEALALLAVRPRRAKGHAADAITAAIIEEDGAVVVDDPRLSTTYADDGRPTRAALELWVKDEQGEDRVRRATGEALGADATGSLAGLAARAELFAWHSRSKDGVGVYLLAQRR